MSDETILYLREQISTNLAFRRSADDFFDRLNSLDESKILIDFSGIESITRSFVHQYIINKVKSDKQILDINVPLDIMPMFELVERQRSEQRASPQNRISPFHAL
jgi:hypothetical protein